jgi:hypothetical protein
MNSSGTETNWRTHLNALKANKLGHQQRSRPRKESMEKENYQNTTSDIVLDNSKVIMNDESQTSWPEYSGINENENEHDVQTNSYEDSFGGVVEEITTNTNASNEENNTNNYSNSNNVAKTLRFSGGESAEFENFTENNRPSRKNVPAKQEKDNFMEPPTYANADDSVRCTPPRPPLSQQRPAMTCSPSTSKINSQNKIVPSQMILPSEKDGARICVSPTSSRKESDFGRKLLEVNSELENSHADEWKEAYTEKGKRYFYNRRTRKSSWKLPSNAILIEATSTPTPTPTIPSSKSAPKRDVDDVTTEQVISMLKVNQTPPGECSQQIQRKTQQVVQGLYANIEEKSSNIISAGTDIYCLFCGKQAHLDIPYMEHLFICSQNKNNNHNEVLLAINSYLNQQKHQQTNNYYHHDHAHDKLSVSDMTMLEEQSRHDYHETVECSTCGRTFADENKLSKHAGACLESSIKKVTPYDGRRKRIIGTPMELAPESFMKSPSGKSPSTPSHNHNQRPSSSPAKTPGSAGRSKSIMNANANESLVSYKHSCPKCDMNMDSKESLLRHLRKCLEEDTEKISGHELQEQSCHFCGKRTQNGNALSRHLAICNKKRQAIQKPGQK